MNIYTMEQWKKDGTFGAEPGQEVTEDIYNEMLNCMPPLTLPKETAMNSNKPIHAGFLMGEPHDAGKYMAFGMSDFSKGKRYYYLGLSRPEQKTPDGFYYYMDCMNAFVNDGLFPAGEFKNDADAIQTAADYEATLYKYEYRNGVQVSEAVLYEPKLY